MTGIHEAGRERRAVPTAVGTVSMATIMLAACVTTPPNGSEPPMEGGAPSGSIEPSAAGSATPTPKATAASEPWEVAHIVEPIRDPAHRPASFYGVGWHDGPGWIAYGEQTGDNRRPAIWTSADGSSWTQAELPDGVEGYLMTVVDVSAAEIDGRSRFVAVLNGYAGSQILTSEDGTSWKRTVSLQAQLHGVVYGPAGYIATGRSDGPLIWHSVDGRSWVGSSPEGLSRGDYLRIAVVDGQYVAVGIEYGRGSPPLDETSPPFLAWTSTDGAEWSEHEILPARDVGCELSDGELGDVFCVQFAADASGGRMVVLGSQGRPFAAVSDGGASWTIDELGHGRMAIPGADVTDDGAIVLAGHVCLATDPRGEAFIWVRDADATEWRSVDWRAEVPNAEREMASECVIDVSVGAERTLVLFHDGSVLLSPAQLP